MPSKKEIAKAPTEIKPVVSNVTVIVIAKPTNVFCTKLNNIFFFENIISSLDIYNAYLEATIVFTGKMPQDFNNK